MSFTAFLAVVLAVNLACTLLGVFIASRSGRDPFPWLLVCAVLGPFGLLALLAAPRERIRLPGAEMTPGPRILVPVDGSDASLEAVAHVASAYSPETQVTLLAVLPLERADGARAEAGSARRREYEEGVESHLARAVKVLKEAGFSVQQLVAFGDPATEILRAAEDGDFERIVMGRRGRGGVARLVLGSVSERVAREASVPVTVAG